MTPLQQATRSISRAFTLAIGSGRELQNLFTDRETRDQLQEHIRELYDCADAWEEALSQPDIPSDTMMESLIHRLHELLRDRVEILRNHSDRYKLPESFLESIMAAVESSSPHPPVA